MRYARAEGRSQHVPVEGAQGADSPGGAPDPFVPEGASAGYCLRISGDSKIGDCCIEESQKKQCSNLMAHPHFPVCRHSVEVPKGFKEVWPPGSNSHHDEKTAR